MKEEKYEEQEVEVGAISSKYSKSPRLSVGSTGQQLKQGGAWLVFITPSEGRSVDGALLLSPGLRVPDGRAIEPLR